MLAKVDGATAAPESMEGACTLRCRRCSQPLEPSRRKVFCSKRCRWQAANGRRRLDVSDPRLRGFFGVVAERVAKGAAAYQDRNWSADPEMLAQEILEELADVAGWGAILFARGTAIAEVSRRLRGEPR